MANNYDNEDGVWRTIGGRRVFIKKGQSLSDAMKESGKFSRVAKNQDLYKKVDEENEKIKKELENDKTLTDEAKRLIRGEYKDKEEKEAFEKASEEAKELVKNEKSNWRDEIKKNNEQTDKETNDLQKKINELRRPKDDWIQSMKDNQEAEKLQDEYYEKFRENERRNAKIKKEEPNEPYEYVEAYAGYKRKFNDTWGQDGSGNNSVSAKMYTNDEFMEHLEDANWHGERRQLLEANLTNQELSYIKDRTKVSAWGVDNLSGKEQTQKLIDEAKAHFKKNDREFRASMGDVDIPQGFEAQFNDYAKARQEKYKATKHEGFGSYNDDYIPVYNGDIDYTGDFARANLSKMSDEEITKALNEQSKRWREAMNENLGDQRTRNGRMNKIFNRAKRQKYEQGSQLLSAEIDKRGLPRYNIYDVKNKDMILVSSPTKEMAERQLKEMYETDKNLQKHYGWKELPKYEIQESKKNAKQTEEEMSSGGNQITNALKKKAYDNYKKQHPYSKMSFEEFKNR